MVADGLSATTKVLTVFLELAEHPVVALLTFAVRVVVVLFVDRAASVSAAVAERLARIGVLAAGPDVSHAAVAFV